MLSYHKICSRFRFAQTTTKLSGISGQPSRTFHLAERADINSFPVQQSPEEGPCESAISEDLRLGQRKKGPDCWEFLWWDSESTGVRVRRKAVIGTVQQYSNLESLAGE